MAAEVSSLMRLLGRRDKDDGGGGEGSRGGELVTRDFLGGYCGGGGGGGGGGVGMLPARDGKELVLGLGSPSACEKRLGGADLNMAPLCSSVFSPPPQQAVPQAVPEAVPQLHNLLSEHPAATLDLRLLPSAAAGGYQSVCTLDKVRSALERAQREPPLLRKLLPHPAAGPASPSSSSTTTSSAKRRREVARDEEGERDSKSPSSSSSSSSVVVQGREDRAAAAAAGMAAAGCPSCLLYVLISRSDPRCPRCNAAIPLPLPPPAAKRPHIDLNVATSSTAPETATAAANLFTTANFF